jgi:cytochrome b
MSSPLPRKRVYDLPLRIFHATFALLFVGAFVIAKTVDDEDPRFHWHMLLGIALGANAILRLLWGFVGSTHSRFLNFPLAPRSLVRYLGGLLQGDRTRWSGHNPASSWLTLFLLGLALALPASGLLMSAGYAKKPLEEAHEIFGTLFVLGVLAHFAGIALHTLRFKELIGLSMFDGKKHGVPATESAPSVRLGSAGLYVALLGVLGAALIRGYDPARKIVTLGTLTLKLGFE